jgi:hypothetical protein
LSPSAIVWDATVTIPAVPLVRVDSVPDFPAGKAMAIFGVLSAERTTLD